MNRSRIPYLVIVLALLPALCVGAAQQPPSAGKTLFQVSTIPALMAGLYDGSVTFKDLKTHGDFGLGTVEGLDGEMLALDGRFYQVTSDGAVCEIPDTAKTPFAAVTFFKRDLGASIDRETDFSGLTAALDRMLPSRNYFYAIKLDGLFAYVKTRSVPRQHRPYPRLVEVTKQQSVFEFKNVRGTVVGFRCPTFASGLNVSGYHLHFISTDRKGGGHVLDCRPRRVTIAVETIPSLLLSLPAGQTFRNINLESDPTRELNTAEKGK